MREMVTETGKGHPLVRSPARQPLYFTLRSAGSNSVQTQSTIDFLGNYQYISSIAILHRFASRYRCCHYVPLTPTPTILFSSFHCHIHCATSSRHRSSIVSFILLLFLFSHIRPMPCLATLPLAGVPFRTPGTKRRRRASFAISSDDT